jgi:CelD/BcsL family acetyltransferase involved in cellulose biosynthesis
VLEISEISEFQEFANLHQQWNETLKKSENNNVFLTWEWLSTWWRHYGKNRQLKILLAQDNETIVAIAPFMLSQQKISALSFKKISFLGTEHTDYRNFILTDRKLECLKLFLRYLHRCDWDFLELTQIPESNEPITSFRPTLERDFFWTEKVSSPCFYIPLDRSFDEFLKQMNGRDRRELNRLSRRLNEQHTVIFKQQNNPATLKDAVSTFVELNKKHWRAKGGLGAFGQDPDFQVFLLDVCKLFAENGWLDFSFMNVDGVPVAGALSFVYNKIFFYYHVGSDPSYSKFGVGSLLTLNLIEKACDKGLVLFDFLQGNESYKGSWASLKKDTLEYSYTRNRPLPVFYDKVMRSQPFNWLKNTNTGSQKKIKDQLQKIFPSTYTVLASS